MRKGIIVSFLAGGIAAVTAGTAVAIGRRRKAKSCEEFHEAQSGERANDESAENIPEQDEDVFRESFTKEELYDEIKSCNDSLEETQKACEKKLCELEELEAQVSRLSERSQFLDAVKTALDDAIERASKDYDSFDPVIQIVGVVESDCDEEESDKG